MFFPFLVVVILLNEHTTVTSASAIDGQRVCFQFLAILKKDAMNILMHTSWWACDLTTWENRLSSGIAGTQGKSICSFDKYLQTFSLSSHLVSLKYF